MSVPKLNMKTLKSPISLKTSSNRSMSPRFNKDKVDFENLKIPIFKDHPIPIDLMEEHYKKGNLKVTGSASYNKTEY
jgi:hypothetical protein